MSQGFESLIFLAQSFHIVQLIAYQSNRLCHRRLSGWNDMRCDLKSPRDITPRDTTTPRHMLTTRSTQCCTCDVLLLCVYCYQICLALWRRCSSTESCLMLEIFNEKFPPIAKSPAIKTASAPQGFIRLSERHSVSFLGNPGVSHPRH